MRAVTAAGCARATPKGAKASIISRDGPMATCNDGPTAKRSGTAALYEGNSHAQIEGTEHERNVGLDDLLHQERIVADSSKAGADSLKL